MDTIERSSLIIRLMLSGRGTTYGEITDAARVSRRTAIRWVGSVRKHFADQFRESQQERTREKVFRITPSRNGWAQRWSRQRPTPTELAALESAALAGPLSGPERAALVRLRAKIASALQ